MTSPDLRSYLQQLDERGWLAHVKREVDPMFELPGVLMRLLGRGQAAIFDRVKNSEFAVVGNVCITREMLALALGCAREQVPRVWRDRTQRLIPPEVVRRGPVKDVVKIGEDARFSDLPICWHSEEDAGPFITASVAIASDPDSGRSARYSPSNAGALRSRIASTSACGKPACRT